MKKLIITLLAVAATLNLAAQTGSIVGNLVDKTSGEGLLGGVVEILQIGAKDTTSVKQFTSGYNGSISASGLKYGKYLLKVQYLGYRSPDLSFDVAKAHTDLGNIAIEQGIEMQAVEKKVEALHTTQNGDTVVYNADAYKVSQDATVEGVLKKMPGIEVAKGSVTAQGESVKKVYVDGKEFNSDDVASAISSISADAVKSIEIFDKLSDNAEFTGMDDGEGFKAMNIVTKKNVRQAQTGQFYGGYGYGLGKQNKGNNYVVAGGYVNIFNNDSKISIRALANNINQQNFSFNDILNTSGNAAGGNGPGAFMTAPSDGVAHSAMFGVNYNDTWGKQDNISFSSNYNFKITNTSNERITNREYFSDSISQNLYDTYYGRSYSTTRNYSHNISANLKAKFSERSQLRIRPSFTYQYNTPTSNSHSEYTPSIDSLVKQILNSNSHRQSWGYRAGLSANYRQKIGQKAGRALVLSFNANYNSNNGNGNSLSQLQSVPDTIGRGNAAYGNYFKDQKWNSTSYGYSIGGGLTYTEPLSAHSVISMTYNIDYRYSNANKHTYLGTYDPADSTWNNYTFSADYSNAQNSGYLTNKVGPGFNYSNNGTTVTGSVFFQNAILAGNRTYPTDLKFKSRSFNNVTYSAMAKVKINKTNTLRMRLYSGTNNPSITDLQDVVDISNVQNISAGNSKLKPTYNHMFFAHFIHSNIDKARTLMVGGGFTLTQDYIAQNVIQNSPGYEVKDPVSGATLTSLTATSRYTTPINMNGCWNVHGMVSYGMPLSFMKCNLNMMAGVSYSQTPSKFGTWNKTANTVDYTTNMSKKISPNASLVLSSNISEKIDFTLSYAATYNNVRNSFNATKNNEYFQHNASATIKVVLPYNFTISTDCNYSQYLGLSGSSYNESFIVWNASIGKKIFRNNLGEINLFVNDILDQNRSFARNWTAQYLENVTNTSIGRYVGIQLVYNLRHYNKKGSKDASLYETQRDSDAPPMPKESGVGMGRTGGTMQGPPGGGPGGGGPGGGGGGPM